MRLSQTNLMYNFIILLICFNFVDSLAQRNFTANLFRQNLAIRDSTPHESEKEILLNSNPQDAYVFLNDSLIGNTPIFIDHHFSALTMKKNGYEDIIIPSDQISSKKIFKLNFVGFEKDESFFSKDIFKYLTAGIILFGGATAYFKLKADHKFEEYESSGSIDLLDQTRKYDLISGLTFAALQINFGLLLYYFLIE